MRRPEKPSNCKPQTLKLKYYEYKRAGKPIPDDLNAALARAFPRYNPETRSMYTKPEPSQCKPQTLLARYYKCKKAGEPIPDDINAAMARAFPRYNPETRSMGKSGGHKRVELPISQCKPKTLLAMYYKCKKAGEPIPDYLNVALARAFPHYDPETRSVYTKPEPSQCKPYTLLARYYKCKKAGEPIPDDINAAMARAFPHYDPETCSMGKIGGYYRTKPSMSQYKPETLRSIYYKYKQAGKPIPDDMNTAMANAFPQYDPKKRCFQHTRKRKSNNTAKAIQNTPTAVVPEILKSDLINNKNKTLAVNITGDKYKTVTVNGTPVIKNIKNVTLKTFLDDVVLGVHYTDEKNIPQWRLWDIGMRPVFADQQSYWIIQSVNCSNNTLYAYTDFHALFSLSKKAIIRNIINPGVFKIKRTR